MHKTLLIFKNELITVVTRRSFVLTLFLLPLVSFVVILVITALQPDQEPNLVSEVLIQNDAGPISDGYVDPGKLIQRLPAWLPEHALVEFDSEKDAYLALELGKIRSYYLIDPNYVQTGRLVAVKADAGPVLESSESANIRQALEFNLLQGNEDLAARLALPADVQETYLAAEPQRDPNNMMTFFLPYGVTMLFYMVILGSASLMLSSITSEKQNRVMEMLVTSISPTQLLAGKITALGLVGLLQTVVWSGTGYALLRLSGRTFDLPAAFNLPPSILGWGVVFFLCGYALYASLMAGIGALVPNLREASQMTTLVILPLVIPLMLITLIVNDPNGTLAVILSLVPLTAPVTVMMRMAATQVPVWQTLTAALLVFASALLVIRSVAGLFRAQNLLSGQAFSIKLFFKALAGKA